MNDPSNHFVELIKSISIPLLITFVSWLMKKAVSSLGETRMWNHSLPKKLFNSLNTTGSYGLELAIFSFAICYTQYQLLELIKQQYSFLKHFDVQASFIFLIFITAIFVIILFVMFANNYRKENYEEYRTKNEAINNCYVTNEMDKYLSESSKELVNKAELSGRLILKDNSLIDLNNYNDELLTKTQNNPTRFMLLCMGSGIFFFNIEYYNILALIEKYIQAESF